MAKQIKTRKEKIKDGEIELPKIPCLADWNAMTDTEKDEMRALYSEAGLDLDFLIKVHSDGCKDLPKAKWRKLGYQQGKQ